MLQRYIKVNLEYKLRNYVVTQKTSSLEVQESTAVFAKIACKV